MADGIVLGPQQSTIQPNDGRPSTGTGPGLPARSNVVLLPSQSGNPEVVGEVETEDGTVVQFDSSGGVTLGAPAIRKNRDRTDFNENLANHLPDDVLSRIGDEVIEGVQADISSRTDLITQYTNGIDLLGTKVEELSQTRGSKRDVSRANHSLLMEAMVKYHAGAEAEMLPAGGPVKVPVIGSSTDQESQLAQDFETDFNYFMTEIAKEYYDDTSKALMQQGYCGVVYKKIFRCPMRRRPVSEAVYLPDLIVSDTATNLETAHRVTHQIEMMKGIVRRMQISGQYRDIDLGQPGLQGGFGENREAQRKIRQMQGLSPMNATMRPQDQPYTIWESDATLDVDDLSMVGYYEDKSPHGLPLPYKVTVCPDTRQVLAVTRNWRPDDDLYLKRNMYVKFGLVPSMGFHDWGFLQLLGNQTRVLRAITRLLITAGMFSNFPGGAKNKQARLSTNELAPGPGEWVDVDVPAGKQLQDLFFPMPYKGPDAVFIQLMEIIKQDAMRLGGTVELEVGEGRSNVPVGTVLAMIEQQMQVMAAVHKRNHRSQKDELRKLREVFAENPADLALLSRGQSGRNWEIETEFLDLNLLPASDPNIPAQVHRIMLANVLMMLSQQNPDLYDALKVHRSALRTIGADPDQYLIDPSTQQPAPPPPQAMAALAKLQLAQQQQQTDAAKSAADIQIEQQKLAVEAQKAVAENQTQREVSAMKAQTETAKIQAAAAMHAPPAVPPAHVVGFDGQTPMPIV